jgi:hypothetical protein
MVYDVPSPLVELFGAASDWSDVLSVGAYAPVLLPPPPLPLGFPANAAAARASEARKKTTTTALWILRMVQNSCEIWRRPPEEPDRQAFGGA